jgi:hypothetical protein
MTVSQSINVLADTPPSQASQLPQGGNAASRPGFAVAVALLLIWLLILI